MQCTPESHAAIVSAGCLEKACGCRLYVVCIALNSDGNISRSRSVGNYSYIKREILAFLTNYTFLLVMATPMYESSLAAVRKEALKSQRCCLVYSIFARLLQASFGRPSPRPCRDGSSRDSLSQCINSRGFRRDTVGLVDERATSRSTLSPTASVSSLRLLGDATNGEDYGRGRVSASTASIHSPRPRRSSSRVSTSSQVSSFKGRLREWLGSPSAGGRGRDVGDDEDDDGDGNDDAQSEASEEALVSHENRVLAAFARGNCPLFRHSCCSSKLLCETVRWRVRCGRASRGRFCALIYCCVVLGKKVGPCMVGHWNALAHGWRQNNPLVRDC